MAATGNEPLQIAAAAGMIFDKQNFHLRRSQNRCGGRASLRPAPLRSSGVSHAPVFSRITAKNADYVGKHGLV
jgi:hypothetical protein